ncbi:hypothetical protein Ddye_027897 [Dipteronia dyeriana]|uniref:Uncharacterized protein n=1 Tax=Dipteronia dyeriana TaxID=168575 RepID=A0AAD9TQ04_9ROSI|nr:hypothetical protein Ddye_027897 [Dipteronia dyeriana]
MENKITAKHDKSLHLFCIRTSGNLSIACVNLQQPGLNVITELVIGYMYPEKPLANVTFKTYGYISMVQALGFVSDFKLGHYMKVPPKSMFIVQIKLQPLSENTYNNSTYQGHLVSFCLRSHLLAAQNLHSPFSAATSTAPPNKKHKLLSGSIFHFQSIEFPSRHLNPGFSFTIELIRQTTSA